MFSFFRRYQYYFFLAITVVIVLSFSFFGTYQTLGSDVWREQIAFTAVNGHSVPRMDVEEMALFLSSETSDALASSDLAPANGLNDGVITKNFLQTGFTELLYKHYQPHLVDDLAKRKGKEQRYRPYVHPGAPFLGTAAIWQHFVPEAWASFTKLQSTPDPTSFEAFQHRVRLFLASRQLSPRLVRYFLLAEEKQRSQIAKDPRLPESDLALFGYHTIEDWFGPRLIRLVSECIMNVAILAEEAGYHVSKEEAMADLLSNAQVSYEWQKAHPSLRELDFKDYFASQLRRMNMDASRAVKIWQQVMLFRLYFEDIAGGNGVELLPLQHLAAHAQQSVVLEKWELPAPFRLMQEKQLENLELYLRAVEKGSRNDPLALPNALLSGEELLKKHPELVEKSYRLRIKKVDVALLQKKISLKDLWSWESDHWSELVAHFPELKNADGKTAEARLAFLDSLERSSRDKIDAFSGRKIVQGRPEWIQEALNQAPEYEVSAGFRLIGSFPLNGWNERASREKLLGLLDLAPLGKAPEDGDPLHQISGDGEHFYRITVIERAAHYQPIAFEIASRDGILDKMRDLSTQQKKSLDPLWNALKKLASETTGKQENLSRDRLAGFRFYPHVKAQVEQLKKGETLVAAFPWDLRSTEQRIVRKKDPELFEEANVLTDGAWSPLQKEWDGNLVIYKRLSSSVDVNEGAVSGQAMQAHALLMQESQNVLFQEVLRVFDQKQAISLALWAPQGAEALP